MSRLTKDQLSDTEFARKNAIEQSKKLANKEIGLAESNEHWKHNNTIIRAVLTECICIGINNK